MYGNFFILVCIVSQDKSILLHNYLLSLNFNYEYHEILVLTLVK
jgi:hypothetical protein